MARDQKFDEDLNSLLTRLAEHSSDTTVDRLTVLKERLIQLHKENVVKINHSVMELVCAKHLIEKGFDLLIEHPLEENLTCDLYGTKGYGSLIVEIETGFVPPDHALDPSTYIAARVASKIVRYSVHAGKFALGLPPHYILRFPSTLIQASRERKSEDLVAVQKLCDRYYSNPPVSLGEIRNARLHAIYVVDVDEAKVWEVEPEKYISDYVFHFGINAT
jgi:hypothetical protein